MSSRVCRGIYLVEFYIKNYSSFALKYNFESSWRLSDIKESFMKSKLIALGKIKDKSIQNLCLEYQSRISKMTSFELIEVPDEKIKKSSQEVLYKEAQKIRKHLKNNAYLICLDEKGKTFNSVEMSSKIERLQNEACSELVWIIGGALGIDEKIKQEAKENWALSKLTFPHHLARLFFLEQYYRSMTLTRGIPYHNE